MITMRQLIEVIDRSEYPILFHCHKGADRTGMASAIALLLRTDTPLEEAANNWASAYGHLPNRPNGTSIDFSICIRNG